VSDGPFEHDNVFFRFFRAGQPLREIVGRAVEGSGLSGEEYGVLSGIAGLQPVAPSELASVLGMPPTTISVYVARFLERRIVRRLPNPRDGRSYLLEVTEEGVDVIRSVGPRLRTYGDALIEASDVSFDELMRALGAIDRAGRRALDADTTSV
jgi:DNA-binding MarR family transcriptional regulator